MKRNLFLALIFLTCASPASARGPEAGGVNGNGVSNGVWCYSPLPLASPQYDSGHEAPCWAGGNWR